MYVCGSGLAFDNMILPSYRNSNGAIPVPETSTLRMADGVERNGKQSRRYSRDVFQPDAKSQKVQLPLGYLGTKPSAFGARATLGEMIAQGANFGAHFGNNSEPSRVFDERGRHPRDA